MALGEPSEAPSGTEGASAWAMAARDRREEAHQRILRAAQELRDSTAAEPRQAFVHLEQAQRLLVEAGDPFGAGLLALTLATELQILPDSSISERWFDESARLFDEAAHHPAAIDVVGGLSEIYRKQWQYLVAATELPGEEGSDPLRLTRLLQALAYVGGGRLSFLQRDLSVAASKIDRALRLAPDLPSEVEVLARIVRAEIARREGFLPDFESQIRKAFRALGGSQCQHRKGRWLSLCTDLTLELAQLTEDAEKYREALELWEVSLAAARQLGEPLVLMHRLIQSAQLLHPEKPDEARRRFSEAEGLLPRIEGDEARFTALAGLSAGALLLRLPETAIRYGTEALTHEDAGPHPIRASVRAQLAFARTLLGDDAGARREIELLSQEGSSPLGASAEQVEAVAQVLEKVLTAPLDPERLRLLLAELKPLVTTGHLGPPAGSGDELALLLDRLIESRDPTELLALFREYMDKGQSLELWGTEDAEEVKRLTDIAAKGDYARFGREWKTFLDATRRRPESSDPGLWRILDLLTTLSLMKAGRWQEALAEARKNVEHAEDALRDLRQDTFQLSARRLYEAHYDVLIFLLVQAGKPDEAFAAAEGSRARALLTLLANQRLRPRKTGRPDLVAKAEELRLRILELDRRGATSVGGRGGEWLELVELRQEYRDLLNQIVQTDPEYSQVAAAEPASLDEIQRSIPRGTVLVAFYSWPTDTVAWILDGKDLRQVRLGIPRAQLETLVETARREIAAPRSGSSLRSPVLPAPAPTTAALEELSRRLLSPLRPWLTEPDLVLVPHGALHRLPFSALRDSGTGRYLIEDFTLTHAPSASSLLLLRRRGGPRGGQPLVLGDPALADRWPPPLGGARREAQRVAAILGSSAYLGEQATEEVLRRESAGARRLHIAAHGLQDPDNPRESYLALAAGGGHDGRLTMGEILEEVDLDHCELVVLSACMTALGGDGGGDEVLGLVRAFLYAGSPTVVASLWPVNDEATAALMERFYRHLAAGEPVARALRKAQVAVLQQPERSAPYFWAAFTVTGDG
jgi:CHAT domain-containing protein